MFNIAPIPTNKITHEEYVARIKAVHSNIEILTQYVNAQSRVHAKCLIDGYEWNPIAHTLYHSGCPRCSGKERKTHDRFVFELSLINPNIEVLSPYVRTMSKIQCKCKIDGNVFLMTPSHLLRGHGCPQCGGTKRKDTQSFKNKMAAVQPNIEVIGEYVNNKTPITCRCKICGNEWDATPNALIRNNKAGTGCPHCNSSRGEKQIAIYLTKKNYEFYTGHSLNGCKYIHHLPFDFYIPSLNTAIEYDGQQHFYCVDFSGHNPERAQKIFELGQIRDEIKTKYCEEHNIKLIRIPYTEFDNIENILEESL